MRRVVLIPAFLLAMGAPALAQEGAAAPKEATKVQVTKTPDGMNVKVKAGVQAKPAEKGVVSPAPASKDAPAASAPGMEEKKDPVYLAARLAGKRDARTFLNLLDRAGMTGVLTDPTMPRTLFVPTEKAFSDMGDALDDLKKPENIDRLRAFLDMHIVNGVVTRASLDNNTSEVMTSTLKRLRVVGAKGRLSVNGHAVAEREITAANGIAYEIDHVLDREWARPGVAAPAAAAPARGAVPTAAAPEGVAPTPVPAPAKSKPWYKIW